MSFESEIKTIMLADPSLNSMVNGGIHYQHLKDNFVADGNTEWIVYDYYIESSDSGIGCKNLFSTWNLNVIVIQKDTNTNIGTITTRLLEYLNGATSENILDINFANDSRGFDQQKGIYTNVVTFKANYV